MSNGSSLNNNAGGELDYMEKMRGDDPAHGIDNHGSSSNVGPDQGSSDKNSAASATASKRSSKSNHVNSAGGAPRDASRKGRSSAASGGSGLFGGLSPSKDELICKMESDIKKLKVDLQLSRNKENDLRDQIVSFMTGKFYIIMSPKRTSNRPGTYPRQGNLVVALLDFPALGPKESREPFKHYGSKIVSGWVVGLGQMLM